jgi:hypothetical protein
MGNVLFRSKILRYQVGYVDQCRPKGATWPTIVYILLFVVCNRLRGEGRRDTWANVDPRVDLAYDSLHTSVRGL